jgi:N6-adenosine-specific RNA methylase IME4
MKRKRDPKSLESDETLIEETNKSLLEKNGEIKRNIIYCDPPWKYSVEKTDSNNVQKEMQGMANSHYETMSLEQLEQLKVPDIAAKDCILLMWTTGPQMQASIELLNAWGFNFKTIFMNWVKTTNGKIAGPRLGFYTRQSCEYVLLATRGSVQKYKKPLENVFYNVFLEDSREHSRKPDYVKKVVDSIFLNVPKIELFARESTDLNWDYWGNEIQIDKFGSNIDGNDEERLKIRKQQMELAEEISKCKKSKLSGNMIDSGNKYGLKRNKQTSILEFLKK